MQTNFFKQPDQKKKFPLIKISHARHTPKRRKRFSESY